MQNRTSHSNLRNNLNDLNLSDEEFEQLRSEYEQESRLHEYSGKSAHFAKLAGLSFLVAASLFIVQKLYFPYGPDLSNLLRLIPSVGTILVLIIGLGLFTRFRRRRKVQNKGKADRKSYHYASADTGKYAESATKEHIYSAGGKTGDETDRETWDPYAFQTRKKWWRSRQERMIAGVCGGLAERYQIDPTIVRALFALAFFSYGFSFVIYIVLAIVLPAKPLKTV